MAEKLTREQAVTKINDASKVTDLLAVKKRDTAHYFAQLIEDAVPGVKLDDKMVYGLEFIPKAEAVRIIEAIKDSRKVAEVTE